MSVRIHRLRIVAAGDLLDFLESEIAAGRNPKTREDWENLMVRMEEHLKARRVADLPASETPDKIERALTKIGFKVHRARRRPCRKRN